MELELEKDRGGKKNFSPFQPNHTYPAYRFEFKLREALKKNNGKKFCILPKGGSPPPPF